MVDPVVFDTSIKERESDRTIQSEIIKTMNLDKKVVNTTNKTHNSELLYAHHKPKVLDLFAGAGGLSEGFIRAGCEIVGHIEMDKNACSTLVTRMIYHALARNNNLKDYKEYIYGKITRDELIHKHNLQKEQDSVICTEIGEHNYVKLIEQIKSKLNGQNLDIIVGGPPCQAYSYIGRARDDQNMKNDTRNYLYKYYIAFLKALKPKIFVFENVPGLVTAGNGKYLRNMRRLMKESGYETDFKILNAADFGVPQNRKRIILVGWSKKSQLKQYPEFPQSKSKYTVRDFLKDVLEIHASGMEGADREPGGVYQVQGEDGVRGEQFYPVQRELGRIPELHAGEEYATGELPRKNLALERLGIRNPKFNILMDHMSRPNVERDLEIYRLAVQAKQKGENIKYNSLPSRLKTHNNEKGFLDRFKVVDINGKASHTVVAHIAKDGHFYIHPDIKQNRSLTVREAARLQTFPDDYKFEGSRGPKFKQIGNAVPPLFSTVLAMELIKYL